jgi:hypothetical protein
MDARAAFHSATSLREAGDLAGLEELFRAGDAAVKAGVLDGLQLAPGDNPQMGPGIIALAVEGAGHSSAEVRRWACYVFQAQDGWGVDVAPAVGPLLALLGDCDSKVRRMAAYATGNLCKRKFDWSRHLTALHNLLGEEDLYVPEAAARALAQLSRAKYDIGPAVPDLVGLLTKEQDYSEPRKEAVKALLHHARKSRAGLDQVRQTAAGARLDSGKREIKRLMDQLGAL